MQHEMQDTGTIGSQRVVHDEGISWRRLLPVAMRLSLALMHVVAWAVRVGLLTTLARREKIVEER